MSPAEHRVSFTCNVCGRDCTARSADIGREQPSCPGCGSTVRMRSIVHTLSIELFGRCMPIAQFPAQPRRRGLGTSDWVGYADRLAERLDYQNTYYHKSPRLDLTDGNGWPTGGFDFFVSSDVFEHVAPPVARAFSTVRRLLKPGGVFVFSVPYNLDGDTVEHFPELHDWQLDKRPDGAPFLRNTTSGGRRQEFDELVFHGGEGATLEMRVFTLGGIETLARECGFSRPRVHHASHLACGTIWEVDWSLTMAMRAV